MLLPILTLIYMCSSLDKSNLGNAKTLGMINDIGGDPTGNQYALLNAFYFISYAPFSKHYLPTASANLTFTVVPLALLGKRTRMAKVLSICAIGWGIAATCFAAVTNFPGAFACRFLVGLGGRSLEHWLCIAVLTFTERPDSRLLSRCTCPGSTPVKPWAQELPFGSRWPP